MSPELGPLEMSNLKTCIHKELSQPSAIRRDVLPHTFLHHNPDCTDYKPSTYFLKTGFTTDAVSPEGEPRHHWQVRLSLWFHHLDPTVSIRTPFNHDQQTGSEIPEGNAAVSQRSRCLAHLLRAHGQAARQPPPPPDRPMETETRCCPSPAKRQAQVLGCS